MLRNIKHFFNWIYHSLWNKNQPDTERKSQNMTATCEISCEKKTAPDIVRGKKRRKEGNFHWLESQLIYFYFIKANNWNVLINR